MPVEAGPGGRNPNERAGVGSWLDSWPTPFPSREAAAAFLGGGSVGAWAAGLEERADGWWPRFDLDVMVRSLSENAQCSFVHEWAQVVCPTLVVLARSGFITSRVADEMLRRRPATTAVTIPGAGHDLHLEQPEILHTVISDFLMSLT